MIITPAKFEDAMKEKATIEEALVLMADTLDSMGYAAGIKVFLNLMERLKHDRTGKLSE